MSRNVVSCGPDRDSTPAHGSRQEAWDAIGWGRCGLLGAVHVDLHIAFIVVGDVQLPWSTSDLAVLDHCAAEIRLKVDFDVLAAVGALDVRTVLHGRIIAGQAVPCPVMLSPDCLASC